MTRLELLLLSLMLLLLLFSPAPGGRPLPLLLVEAGGGGPYGEELLVGYGEEEGWCSWWGWGGIITELGPLN